MLYRLEIENFYSIRDPQIIDLRVPENVRDDSERFATIFPGSSERAPKIVAVFGANGSGKSTVLRALALMAWFRAQRFRHSGKSLPCERFDGADSPNRPIRLAVAPRGRTDLECVSASPK